MQASIPIPQFRFAPASFEEQIVFGSERPGYGSRDVPESQVDEWLSFMEQQGVKRVCCLLDEEQLDYYNHKPLLQAYEERFGMTNVLHALVPDFTLCDTQLLTEKIMPFLEHSKSSSQKTVVHCAGGKGRTGHILAAWIVRSEKRTPEEALAIVASLYREPLEAVERGNASRDELISLLRSAAV